MTSEFVAYTQVVSVVTFIVTLFFVYRVLAAQKDATIALLKEKTDYLERQLQDVSKQSPDALAQALTDRLTQLEAELARLYNDKKSSQELIRLKERELRQTCDALEDLGRRIERAQEVVGDFLCPRCRAPIATSEHRGHTISLGDYGDDFVDWEYVEYECGRTLEDDTEIRPCGRMQLVSASEQLE